MMGDKKLSKTETETVKVTLELPKQVADWFTDNTEPLEERLTAELVELVYSQIDGSNIETLTAKYGLGPVFRKYGLLKEAPTE